MNFVAFDMLGHPVQYLRLDLVASELDFFFFAFI